MKLFASTVFTLLMLVCGQSYAEQVAAPSDQSANRGITIPACQQKSAIDIHHRQAGSDKSDELGVAYYHQQTL